MIFLRNKVAILYVINDLGLGGAQRIVADLACHSNKTLYTPIVCNFNISRGKEIEQELLKAGVKVVNFRSVVCRCFVNIWKLFHLIKKYKICIVHSHLFRSSLSATIAARLAGVRCVVSSEHNTTTFTTRPWFYRQAARLYLRLNTGSIAVSNAVRQSLISLYAAGVEKSVVIYNGIDLNIFAPERYNQLKLKHSSNRCFDVGTLIRQDPRKGFDIFLQCARKFKQRNRAVNFIAGFRGDSPFGTGDINWVRMDEGSHGTAKYLSRLDVFVLPSMEEGLGLAAIEAMAMGVPVVAAAVGGLKEVVRSEVDGLLVAAGDVAGFVAAIVRLKANPELAQYLAENGRKRVLACFSLERMVRETFDFYRVHCNAQK